MDLRRKRVLVVGLGRSGLGAARLCLDRGAHVTVTDSRDAARLASVVDRLAGRAVLELSGHRADSFLNADLIVISPGVPPLPELAAAREAGVAVMGELELASRFVQGRLVAITGTNGKSTTTSLLGAMVAASGRPTFVGGNLGPPLVEAVGTDAAGPDGALVVEVSSFQLETVERFHPQVALLLNLSEDHLDRHPSYAEYIAAKARVFQQQSPADFAVVNGEPEQDECLRLARAAAGQVLTFQVDGVVAGAGAWSDSSDMVLRLPHASDMERVPRGLLQLAGRHNLQNALAALLGARLFGADLEACRRGLAGFHGLPHRMELVRELQDVLFYNDSKATNVGSVVGSLTGFPRGVVLIAGGKDKGGDYAPLLPLLGPTVREVVLIGAAAEIIAGVIDQRVPVHRAADLVEAVHIAAALARPQEAVVLSPACSSYDMFTDFEHRGRVFAEAVRDLKTAGCA